MLKLLIMYKLKVYEDKGYSSIYDHKQNEEITTNESDVIKFYNTIVENIKNIVDATKTKCEVHLPNYLKILMQNIEDFNFKMKSMRIAERHWAYFKKAADDFVSGINGIYAKYPILERSEDRFGRMLKPHVDTFIHSLYQVLPAYDDPKDLKELE